MYDKIFVALENTEGDQTLLSHISQLAKIHHSHLLLVHVADGWAAWHYDDLLLNESEEMVKDRHYLSDVAQKLKEEGFEVSAHLALGNPPKEILNLAHREKCDLIAMISHGHHFLVDLFLGSTIEEVRHKSNIPLLILKKT